MEIDGVRPPNTGAVTMLAPGAPPIVLPPGQRPTLAQVQLAQQQHLLKVNWCIHLI